MADSYETTPHEANPDKPDDFDILIDGLSEHMEDPYLKRIHKTALAYEAELQKPGSDGRFEREKLMHLLDAEWNYLGEQVEITGKIWTKENEASELKPRMCFGEKFVSRGFSFYDVAGKDGDAATIKACHYLENIYSDDSGETHVLPVIITIDDIAQFILPRPSPDAREHRFAYSHEEQAKWIDDLAFTSRRADQVILSFREFYIDANLGDEDDLEMLRDAMEYMRRRAEIEPLVNYRISLVGPLISVSSTGITSIKPTKGVYTRPIHINDIILRPADVTALVDKGSHRCTPYLDAVAFNGDGTDEKLLIPCASIAQIHSIRYNSAP